MDTFKHIWARAGPVVTGFLAVVIVLGGGGFETVAAATSPKAGAEKPAPEKGSSGGLGLRCAPRLLAVAPGATQPLTVQVNTAPAADLIVNLISNNPAIASIPDRVTIPAGQTSAPVTVTGGTGGATFITASTDTEQATSNVYVAARFSGDVSRLPVSAVRVTIPPHPQPTLALPLRVLVLPIPFAITQPVKAEIRNP